MYITLILNGLTLAAVYFLVTVGVVVIMGHMGMVNLAHGEFIMLGAYFCYYFFTVMGLPFIFSVLMATVSTGVIGILFERILFKRLYGKVSEGLLVTYALGLMLQQIVKLICGANIKMLANPLEGTLKIGSILMPYYNLFIIAMAVVVFIITKILFSKSNFGKKIRAITDNRQMVRCMGIDTAKVDMWTFAYGCAMAGLCGAVIAPIKSVSYVMGGTYLTDSFITVVTGGLTSLSGIALASGIMGESISMLGSLWDDVTAKMMVFFIIIVLIRFRPEGLFTSEKR